MPLAREARSSCVPPQSHVLEWNTAPCRPTPRRSPPSRPSGSSVGSCRGALGTFGAPARFGGGGLRSEGARAPAAPLPRTRAKAIEPFGWTRRRAKWIALARPWRGVTFLAEGSVRARCEVENHTSPRPSGVAPAATIARRSVFSAAWRGADQPLAERIDRHAVGHPWGKAGSPDGAARIMTPSPAVSASSASRTFRGGTPFVNGLEGGL